MELLSIVRLEKYYPNPSHALHSVPAFLLCAPSCILHRTRQFLPSKPTRNLPPTIPEG
jgi:hypothetical protein